MKKLQVMIDDELMKTMKYSSIEKGITLKDLVTEILESHFAEPKPKQKTIPAPKTIKKPKTEPAPAPLPIFTPKPQQQPEPQETYDGLVPNTAKVGKPEKMMKQYWKGSVSWMVLEGCRAHFDKDGNSIPFRFTDENGKVWEPDEEDLEEIRRAMEVDPPNVWQI